jgi:putative transposase
MTTSAENSAKPRKKVRRFDEAGHAHFLTFSCYRRMPLLGKDRTRLWFLEALQDARKKHCFDLWA